MQINLRSDSVEISGYVNAVERNSKPLMSRIGRFVERIRKGAFSRALSHSDEVYLLLNHDKSRVLGSTKQGNLVLTEDSIGLHARATVTDPEVIESARRGDLVGWSFGFYDTPDGVENGIDEETKLPLRKLRDMDLREVSILDRTKSPAYDGTLIMARSDDDFEYWGEPCIMVDYTPAVRMLSEMYDNLIEERENPYRDPKTGRFTFAPKFGSTDTSDAVAEQQGVGQFAKAGAQENSLTGHLDKYGRLTNEREQHHRDIIADHLDGKTPVEGQATMTMLGGGPASGKSSIMSTKDEDLDEHTVKVDPDDFKKSLDGYEAMAKQSELAAGYYHEESSALAKRFYAEALSENMDVIYDGTGDGSIKSVEKKINQAKEAGYRVEGKYVTIDTEDAVRRNQKRYEDALAKGEVARKPNEDLVRKTHQDVTDILVATAPEFDYTELWDNNGEKGQQKLIATGGGGKYLTPVQGMEAEFNAFLSKGALGVGGFEKQSDGSYKPTDELLQKMKGGG